MLNSPIETTPICMQGHLKVENPFVCSVPNHWDTCMWGLCNQLACGVYGVNGTNIDIKICSCLCHSILHWHSPSNDVNFQFLCKEIANSDVLDKNYFHISSRSCQESAHLILPPHNRKLIITQSNVFFPSHPNQKEIISHVMCKQKSLSLSQAQTSM